MRKGLEICPKCIGAKEVMVAKESRGFEYKGCDLCNVKGYVTSELEEDYVLSLNENIIDFDD
jgi:hypothetical protein